MNVRFVCVMSAMALLAGCSSSDEHGRDDSYSVFFHYQCDGPSSFDVSYSTGQRAILRLSDHSYRLIQVAAGSGTKYILDDHSTQANPITLFTKGDAARLEANGVIFKNCWR
ncbi:MliC family protein [Vibrio fluvialis]|uniref:MliC family protein n=1 Tax=Vibrio fluvialis TaxID=676 RepID=UPI00192AC99D|nr:MliC family protein [Vibrio fluvialis]ELL4669101.1 MliC family protein [Vibrio fluvialis]MBL4259947.1 MliC family protein [Vibrio fluvialis]QTH04194.1 MliC family protein [Vibrio fluvialis]